VKAKNSIAIDWENLKPNNVIPETLQENSDTTLADFLGRLSNNRPVSATEESTLITTPNEALNQDAASLPVSKQITEPQPTKTPAREADERNNGSEAKPQPLESKADPPKSGPLQPTPKKGAQSFVGNFEVVQESFLRDRPESDAAITVLLPGTSVRVESKKGSYFYVRSLSDPALRGYVHREDAFFERIQ
jgi:hypothetical protein